MLWAISCVTSRIPAAIRDKVLQPHRVYLGSQKGILVLAGATQNDDGTEAIGSLFIASGQPRKAEGFLDGDPFTPDGVFKSITITRMRKGSGILRAEGA